MRFFFVSLLITIELFSQVDYSKRDKLSREGISHYRKKDTIKLQKVTNALWDLYVNEKDSIALAKYYQFKAEGFQLKHSPDSSYYYHHESKNISVLTGDFEEAAKRLISIAFLQSEAKDFVGSEVSSIEGLNYLESIKSSSVYIDLSIIYNNLGIISDEFNQYEDALRYFNKALEINSKISSVWTKERGYMWIQNNIGRLYQRKNEHKKAIEYFKKGLNVEDVRQKRPSIYASLLENLAASSFLSGDKKNVLSNYMEVLKIRDSLNDRLICNTYVNIADYYKDQGRLRLAKANLKEALKNANEVHYNRTKIESLRKLAELTSGKKSKRYLKEYLKLNDSLLHKERSLKHQFAKIRYETDKKQQEIIRQKQQKLVGWLAAVIAFLGLGFTITIFVFRRRKLIYQTKLHEVLAREQERKQIAKALHDEVAGDLRLLHKKLEKSSLNEEANKLNAIKDNVRNLSHQLSSVPFEKVGFKDQLINLISDYFEPKFRIIIRGIENHDWSTVNDAVKRLLYLCIRESVQNSKKHAQATEVIVTFLVHKKNVFLNITDNGIGFDTKVRKKGIGLYNLRERVEELQGTFILESTVGVGTKTDIQIPLDV
ncbi:tetratricopeptide repeat-containing sensor histidine kinase [Tenacibaculum sp. C7A-26P2]|uniref:tetratricopeptide repeat-containing sensor histidine kinase n=1 Tax=Tenacibaculum sp. C7A-26P2 TaxID=3447504 RepID=UPI003F87430D